MSSWHGYGRVNFHFYTCKGELLENCRQNDYGVQTGEAVSLNIPTHFSKRPVFLKFVNNSGLCLFLICPVFSSSGSTTECYGSRYCNLLSDSPFRFTFPSSKFSSQKLYNILISVRAELSGAQIPAGVRVFFFCKTLKSNPGSHPSSCAISTGVLSRDKAAGTRICPLTST